MEATAFACCFLVFMIPMPEAMEDTLETWSTNRVCDGREYLFRHWRSAPSALRHAVPAPEHYDPRGSECSGIRSSWVLFITSVSRLIFFCGQPGNACFLFVLFFRLASCETAFGSGSLARFTFILGRK